jgi:hypothetical protein
MCGYSEQVNRNVKETQEVEMHDVCVFKQWRNTALNILTPFKIILCQACINSMQVILIVILFNSRCKANLMYRTDEHTLRMAELTETQY